MENIVERGAILSPGPVFRMPAELANPWSEQTPLAGGFAMREYECRHVLPILQKTGWKVRGKGGAAELLDMRPSTLASRMKKLGIQRPEQAGRKKWGVPHRIRGKIPSKISWNRGRCF